ncbi:MAG: hypothetical protein ACK46X_07070 [Candidatus Sericytochromatia bacterium]
MADGRGEPPIKKKLLGWVQGALGKLEQALDEKPAAAAPAAKPAPGTGPLARAATPGTGALPQSPAQPSTGPLNRPNPAPAPAARAPQTGRLGTGTDSLTRSATPAPSDSGFLPAPPPVKDPEVAAAESKERMGFIIAYMQDPEGDPAFQDKQLVYKVLTEERSYQQNLLVKLSEELKALPPGDERALEVEALIANARTRQGQLFTLLKRLTGVRGKTGGTGFIAKAPELPPDPIVKDDPPAPEPPPAPGAP